MTDRLTYEEFLRIEWESSSRTLVGPDGELIEVVPYSPHGPGTSHTEFVYDLPFVLAGPIVRHTTQSAVHIWIATSCAVEIRGRVIAQHAHRPANPDGPVDGDGGGDWSHTIGRGNAFSAAYGNRLHVTLVKLAPDPAVIDRFPVDEILGYDFHFFRADSGPGFTQYDISPGIAFTEAEITLHSSLPYPTFFIASRGRSSTRFIHMSCRKPHGEGFDAMALALARLEATALSVSERASFALLTGDQVYADDVSNYAIARIRQLAPMLCGRSEPIPGVSTRLSRLRGGEERGRRGGIILGAGMTSTEGENHVLGFYEFAALYMLNWSPGVFEYLDERDPGSTTLAEFRREQNFHPAAAMRFLANCATYMAFDDHEVTDDWNISQRVAERTRRNATARRVIANGLAAYWLFQYRGNDPDDLSLDSTIRSHLTNIARGRNACSSGRAYENALWDYDRWAYVVNSPLPVVVLDTRTQRAFPIETNVGARLMDGSECRRVRQRLEALDADPAYPIFVVSPAPVLGWSKLEERAQAWMTLYRVPGASLQYGQDPEPWSYNGHGLLDFLETLQESRYSTFVFLSGDVHYAFNAIGTWRRGGTPQSTIILIQLTSSSAKNAMTDLKWRATGAFNIDMDDRLHRFYGFNAHEDGRNPLSAENGRTRQERYDSQNSSHSILEFRFAQANGAQHTIVRDNNFGEVELVREDEGGWTLIHSIHKTTDGSVIERFPYTVEARVAQSTTASTQAPPATPPPPTYDPTITGQLRVQIRHLLGF